MNAMANVTPIIATIKNTGVKEKTLKEADVVPKASILDFCEEHYEDILPIIMDRARHDKQKEVQTRPDFRESSRKIRRERENFLNSRVGNSPIRPCLARRRTRGSAAHSRGRPLSRNRPRIRDRLRGVKESYDDAYSSYGIGTKYRDRSHDRDHSRSVKRWRESESLPSRGSESSTRRHTGSQRRKDTSHQMKKTWPYPGLARM
ncbi:hypothetical protein Tco_0759701 [Tanacetum coccineum]